MEILIKENTPSKTLENVIEILKKEVKNISFKAEKELMGAIDNAFKGWTWEGSNALFREEAFSYNEKYDYVYWVDYYFTGENCPKIWIKINKEDGGYKLIGVYKDDIQTIY